MVLRRLQEVGEIKDYKVSEGNWMRVMFYSARDARAALDLNGTSIRSNELLGVLSANNSGVVQSQNSDIVRGVVPMPSQRFYAKQYKVDYPIWKKFLIYFFNLDL